MCALGSHSYKVQRQAKLIYSAYSQETERGMRGVLSPMFFDDMGTFILWKFIELYIYDLCIFMLDHISVTKKKCMWPAGNPEVQDWITQW